MSNQLPILASLAEEYGLDANTFWSTIQKTIMPNGTSQEQALAFLTVCDKYNLNPITKEIYAFPSKGGIEPIVGIDGWLAIANRNANFDGLETAEDFDSDGNLLSCTVTIWRKDRSRPTSVTEYYSECKRDTHPWRQWPVRMLRNKAIAQCIRITFSVSGIYEPDEGERVVESMEIRDTSTDSLAKKTQEKIEKALAAREAVEDAEIINDTSANGVADQDSGEVTSQTSPLSAKESETDNECIKPV